MEQFQTIFIYEATTDTAIVCVEIEKKCEDLQLLRSVVDEVVVVVVPVLLLVRSRNIGILSSTADCGKPDTRLFCRCFGKRRAPKRSGLPAPLNRISAESGCLGA